MIAFREQLGLHKLFLAYSINPAGAPIIALIQRAAKNGGIPIVGEAGISLTATDYSPLATKAVESGADGEILLSGESGIIQMITTTEAAGGTT